MEKNTAEKSTAEVKRKASERGLNSGVSCVHSRLFSGAPLPVSGKAECRAGWTYAEGVWL